MTHIEQLIQDMCPNGVEFKTLGEVTYSIKTGLNPRTNFVLNADGATHYYVTVKEITTGKILFSDKTDRITEDARQRIQERSLLEKDDILFSGIGTIGKVAIVDIPTENWNCSESVYLIKPVKSIVVPKYLMYFLGSVHSKEQYESLSVGSTLKGVRKNVLEAIEIPIPPLEIQEKIVECLDKFSALAAELQAELHLRRKQYEYYRTQLLTPHSDCNSADNTDDCNWENVKFSDVASYIRGVTYNKHDELHEQSDSAIKVLRANNITLESNSLNLDEVKFIRSDVRVKQEQYLRKNDIFICAGSGSKEHVGKVAFINEDMDYTFGGFMGVVRTREKVTSKFLYYILTSNIFKEYLIGALNSTTINNLNNTIMSEFSFMVPSLAEQARIVSILDKFEALTTSLSDGIPAEQAAQQKRYEYYRDLLLTFDRKAE